MNVAIHWPMRHTILVFLVGFAPAFVAGTSPDAGTTPWASVQCNQGAYITSYDRAQVVAAIAGTKHEISLDALAHDGCFDRVVGLLKTTGATVDFSERRSGFIALRTSPIQLLDILETPGIDDMGDIVMHAFVNDDIAPYVPQSSRTPGPVPSYHVTWLHVATKNTPEGPFFPVDEIGLTTLWRQFPDADGRGIRVGLVDFGLDLLHPAMRYAKDAEGRIVPKLAGIVTTTRPDQDNEWVETYPISISADGNFKAAGTRWRAPPGQSYRFGILRWWSNNPDNMQAQDKQYAVQLAVGVLWNTTKDVVRVDTDGDHNFTNNVALHDYRVVQKIAWFGKLDAKGDNRIGFAIHIDHDRKAVFIDIAGGEHGAFVGGTLAANRLSGGIFDGAAPMAQIVDVRTSLPSMTSFVAAFADPRIDVINCSCRVGSMLPAEAFQRIVLERLLRVFPKPLICVCAVYGAISVDDYQSSEQLRRNRRSPGPYREAMNTDGPWSSSGWISSWTSSGSSTGGIENWLLGPSASLTTQSRYMPNTYPRSDNRQGLDFGGNGLDPHGFDRIFAPPAPAGYMIGSNNSPTTPVVSGVVADLIDLARHNYIRYDAVRMSNALFTGSRIVAGFPDQQQENGLVNAAGAWRQLAAMSHVDDPANPVLTHFDVFASSGQPIDGYFQSLTHSGASITRSLWIVRRGGYTEPRLYRLAIHADGTGRPSTFTPTQKVIAFQRDRPVHVTFRIDPKPGEHLAYLQLIDAASATVMQAIPLHVIVPETLRSEAGVAVFRTEIAPRRTDSRYFAFPGDVQAIHVHVRKPFGGSTGEAIDPAIEDVSVAESLGIWMRLRWSIPQFSLPIDAADHVGPLSDLEALLAPSKGPINLYWENRGRPEYETPYEPPAPTVPEVAIATFETYRVITQRDGDLLQFTNVLAPLDGRIEFYFSTQYLRRDINSDRHGFAKLNLLPPTDATELHVMVRTPSFSNKALDAYLLKCIRNACASMAQSRFVHGVANLVLSSSLCSNYDMDIDLSCATSAERRYLISSKESVVLVVLGRKQLGGLAAYTVVEDVVRPVPKDSEPSFTWRQNGETWNVAILDLPSNKPLYWALRLAPLQADSAKGGYLTQLTPVPQR